MAEPIAIQLYTTESCYVGAMSHPTKTPYRRVVGMTIGSDGMSDELWTPTDSPLTGESYERSDVDMMIIEGTAQFFC